MPKEKSHVVSNKPSTERGLKKGWRRATLIVKKENLKKIKAIAYWERKDIKEIVDEAFDSYLKNKKPKTIKKYDQGSGGEQL